MSSTIRHQYYHCRKKCFHFFRRSSGLLVRLYWVYLAGNRERVKSIQKEKGREKKGEEERGIDHSLSMPQSTIDWYVWYDLWPRISTFIANHRLDNLSLSIGQWTTETRDVIAVLDKTTNRITIWLRSINCQSRSKL